MRKTSKQILSLEINYYKKININIFSGNGDTE